MKLTSLEKDYYKNLLNDINTKKEIRNFIFDLKINQKFDYRKTTNIVNLKYKTNTQTIVDVMQYFDKKLCVNKEKCVSPDGPIKSFNEFYFANTLDGKSHRCKDCISFSKTFNNANESKRNHMLEFQKLENYSSKVNYIVDLHTKFNYNITTISKITRFNIDLILEIFHKRDIKTCNNFENCKHPNGPILSFNNFYKDKDSICSYCQKFNINYYNASKKKREKMNRFQKLSVEKEKNKFILNLYYEYHSLKILSSITLYSTKDIGSILKSFDILHCSNGKNCLHVDGPFQSFSNFTNDIRHPLGKKQICQTCTNQYYVEHFEGFVKNRKKYQLENKELIKKRTKEYNNNPALYNTYAERLKRYQEVRRDPNNSNLFQVRCHNHKCSKWFNPVNKQIRSRLSAINGEYTSGTEYNLYCSDKCKQACPLYRKQVVEVLNEDRIRRNKLELKDFKRLSEELRKLKIYIHGEPIICQRCNRKFELKNLELHHKIPRSIDPRLEADVDNLIWLCKNCHKKVHLIDGCTYGHLQKESFCY